MDYLRQLVTGILEAWKKLSLSARINIVLAGLAVVVLIGVVIITGAAPQYVTLTTSTNPEEISEVRNLLVQQGISYRLEGDNTLLVPMSSRSEAIFLLADNDLPVGRAVPPGFELFAESELMTNQWLQDIKFMRAVQGELQRQLNSLDLIDYSHVLIREAKEELFISEQKPSEANVTIAVTRPLTKQEVKAVVSMISHAGGPNLHPGNITLMTTAGKALHLPADSEFAALANSKLDMVVEWEQQRKSKLETALRELGIRGIVSVSAKMSFDEKEVTDEKVTEGTELSTFETSTTVTSAENIPEGAPGAFANVPESAALGGTTTSEETTEEIANYEPSRTLTRTKTGPGDVVKFVVSLIVEGDYEETTDEEGNTARKYVGLAEEEKKKYTDLAMAAVGEGEVETEVTIHDHPFSIEGLAATAATLEQFQSAQTREWVLQLVWKIGQVLAILLGFFVFRMVLRRAIVAPEIEIEEEAEVVELPEATREDLRRGEVAAEVVRLSKEDPEVVAALLRTWMSEEKEQSHVKR